MRFTSLTLAALLFAAPAFAAKSDEPVQHYAPEKPTSIKHAIELLDAREKKAGEALGKNDLEGVHEQSYTMEAAGDYLEAHMKKQQAALDGINEAVQEIHALSEKGDAQGLRKALPRLKKYTRELEALMQTETK